MARGKYKKKQKNRFYMRNPGHGTSRKRDICVAERSTDDRRAPGRGARARLTGVRG